MTARPAAHRGLFWLGVLALAAVAAVLLVTIRIGEPVRLLGVALKPKWLVLAAAAAAFLAYVGRQGWRRPARAWVALAAKVVMAGVSLGLALLIAEIGVRHFLRNNQGFNSLQNLRDKERGKKINYKSFTPLAAIVKLSDSRSLVYELMPDLDMDFGHQPLRTNSRGMRDSREYAPGPHPGVVRIVGIGDSGMFGWSVAQDQDYLAVLETNLSRRAGGPRYEVLNMAVPGYNTFQEYELLRTRGLDLQPDIVVVGWCDNDVYPPFLMFKPKTFDRRDKSYLYSMLFYRSDPLLAPEILKMNELDRKFMDPALLEFTGPVGAARALNELRDLGKQHGFKVLVVGPLQPVMMRYLRTARIPYMNTFEAIPPGSVPEEYAVHFMHPRANGHRLIAEKIEEKLDELGWLKANDE